MYNVQADIFVSNKNWFFLNTEKAVFLVNEKTLFSNTTVKGFYDDGSSFQTSGIEYNFNTGIATSEEGIVMFGKWGNIKSNNFSFNTFKDTYNFDGNTIMNIYLNK